MNSYRNREYECCVFHSLYQLFHKNGAAEGVLNTFSKTHVHVHKVIHSEQIYFNLFRGRLRKNRSPGRRIKCGDCVEIKNLNNLVIYFECSLNSGLAFIGHMLSRHYFDNRLGTVLK